MRAWYFLCAIAVGFAPRAASADAEAGWPDLSTVRKVGGGENDAAVIASAERYLLLPPVPGARANAEAWFDYLTKGRGVPVERVTLLRDHQVTTSKLRRFAADAAQAVGKGGTLWFVFIGHGAPAKDGKDGVLVGVDAQQDADSLFDRSVARSEILETLGKSQAARVVAVIDACFSGRSAAGKPLVPGLQPLVVTREASHTDPRMVVLTAGKSDEFAGPLPGALRPAFSYLVLGGLRGWAAGDGGGAVTAKDLASYAAKVIRALVKDRSQTPTAEGGAATEPLGRGFEKGPDLAALVKRYADTAVEAPRAELPRIPDLPALSADVKLGADVEVLVAYDGAMKVEKTDDAGAKAQAWKALAALGGKNPYREDAARRAAAWDDLARKLGDLEKAAAVEWAKVEKLMPLSVLGESEKVALLAQFAARFAVLQSYRARIEPLAGQNHTRSAAVFQRACDGGAAWACGHLGHQYWNGLGVAKDFVRAVELWRPACDRGDQWSCHGVATAYWMGAGGVSNDDARAVAIFRRACDGAIQWSCATLGWAYWAGRGVPRDDGQAVAHFKKACDGGLHNGCVGLGHAHWNARGVPLDDARSAALWKKACDSGDSFGCSSVAHAYASGRGLAKDEARAAALWQTACDGGDLGACYQLGQLYWGGRGVARDHTRALALFEKTCGKIPDACAMLGHVFWSGEGGVARDDARAVALWKRSCDAGESFGCASLGHAYWGGRGAPLDKTRAVALWKRACDGGNLGGCTGVGVAHQQGVGGMKNDQAAAVAIFQRTCDGGEMWGCHGLGWAYRLGLGVAKDEARAKTLFKKACDGGFPHACPEANK